MRCPQPQQQMHMVFDAANCFRDPLDVSHHAAEIGVHPFAPGLSDYRRPIFRAEDDVVMEREVSGWHGVISISGAPAGALRFLRLCPVADATG